MAKKPPEEEVFWFDENKKEKGTFGKCRYCGKELPRGNMWWCNSIHRFWNQICGKTRYR